MPAFEIFYLLLMAVICVYGVHRYWLVLGTRGPDRATPASRDPAPGSRRSPTVLVQLPIYNEGPVVRRLIDSAAAVDWDRDALEIQVLDDSDDGSSEVVAERIAHWRERGVPIQHIRRRDRSGFKAGALAAGLRRSDAEFVAIFDADFVIPPDFLHRTLPDFHDPRMGMVQARWGFLNERRNLLTRVQALLLDGHFHVEHRARARGGRFFNFNGTAGVWRRAAIEDAGGWRATTVTEDLDLSLRAWLRGWRFDYRDDVEAPSSLPEAMSAFKIQQNRWVSGSVQTAMILLGSVLRSTLKPLEKVDLFFCLTGNFIYLPLLLLALSIPPAVLLRLESPRLLLWLDLPFFLLATVSVIVFYTRARRRPRRGPGFFIVLLPSLMALGLGLSLHNTRAILRGLFSRTRVFESTPKGGLEPETTEVRRRRRRRDWLAWAEPIIAAYVLAAVALSLGGGSFVSLPFLALFGVGYLFVFSQTLRSTAA